MKLNCPNCREENEFETFASSYTCRYCGLTFSFDDWVNATKTIKGEQVETKPKRKPLYSAFWSLGEGKGIKVTLWKTNLRLERRERDTTAVKEWKTTQEISLARPILEKLYIRLPYFFAKMKKGGKETDVEV